MHLPLSLAVTTQGDKQVMVGDKILDYFPGQSLLTTIDVPVVSHVTRATTLKPYLGLLLRLDARSIALAASEMKLPRPDAYRAHEPMSIETLDPALLDALRRLVDLLDDPVLLPRLAPLVQQEIIIRLLTGPHGPQLRQLIGEDSASQQIASVVAWIKQNFTKAIRVDDLAANANMSPSAFRQRFHDITGMSPLQYQKQLRLQEARQLMLNQKKDAGQAAILVGYQSASQFTASTAASSAHRLTAISRISVCTAGRPGRRFGYVRFRAISSRCQRSMVSGGTMVATSVRIGRPSRAPRRARRRRSASDRRTRRPRSCSFSTRFSALSRPFGS